MKTINSVHRKKPDINWVVVFAFSVFSVSCSSGTAEKPEPPQKMPVMVVTSASAMTYNDYPASIEGTVNVEIRPQVGGVLDKIFVDEGSMVTIGDPIFKIDDRLYREALNNAMASLQSAIAEQVNARLEVERLTPLVANKIVAEYQLKVANSKLQIAEANVKAARANESTAQINLGYTLIKAPVGGIMSRLLKKQGSLVAPQDEEALTQISHIQHVYAYFSLSENDFVNFKMSYPGHTLTEKLNHVPPVTFILADGSEYPLKGKLDMIDGQFNKNTGSITVRATFPNEEGLLRSGNTGKLRIGLMHPNVMIIPTKATLEIQNKTFVFIVNKQNKVKKAAVTIIGKSGENYLIASGINEKDRIVTNGIDRLQEGNEIIPQLNNNK